MRSLRNRSAVATTSNRAATSGAEPSRGVAANTAGAAVACLVLLLGVAVGCAKPATRARAIQPESSPEAPSAAASTSELEEKAAGYEERFQEIQAGDMTADEKAQAVGELVDEQQRTVREAEDGSGESGDDSQR
jgi:hypothetical protein